MFEALFPFSLPYSIPEYFVSGVFVSEIVDRYDVFLLMKADWQSEKRMKSG